MRRRYAVILSGRIMISGSTRVTGGQSAGRKDIISKNAGNNRRQATGAVVRGGCVGAGAGCPWADDRPRSRGSLCQSLLAGGRFGNSHEALKTIAYGERLLVGFQITYDSPGLEPNS